MTEDKKKKEDNLNQLTDAQKEELRKITQARRISKAPPPITPVGGLGPTVISRMNEVLHQAGKPIIPITGIELMQRLSLDAAKVIYLAQQGLLHPFFPESFYSNINWLMVQDDRTQASDLTNCLPRSSANALVKIYQVL